MKSAAVIGTGIAGMAAAYLLRQRYNITMYEKNDYIGGHTNTVSVPEGSRELPIDTGFMVYNDRTYPNLVRFFEHLGIESRETSMSFSVNEVESGFETSYTNLATFFPRWRDLLHAEKYRLLIGLRNLFTRAKQFLSEPDQSGQTLAEFIENNRIDSVTTNKFLLPMTAAIWSTPTDRMLDYPAQALFRFLANHGMLGFGEQFQWKTLVGGSQQYKAKLLKAIGPRIQVGNAARQIRTKGERVEVIDQRGGSAEYDLAIVATHADQALRLLESPTPQQEQLLSAFTYNVNPVALHTDASVMPRRKRTWASWNYRYQRHEDRVVGSTHYWMNRLQDVSQNDDYFVSVDYPGELDESKVKWRFVYEHPRYDTEAMRAQTSLPQLNRNGPVRFCGSYFRYGFHEDAYTSALDLCTQLNDGKDPLS